MPTVADLNTFTDLAERLDRFSFSGKRNGAAAMRRWLSGAAKRRGLEDYTRAVMWAAWTVFYSSNLTIYKIVDLKELVGKTIGQYRCGDRVQ